MILVDPPLWPARGRLWSHLVSDHSIAELHAFAREVGLPVRGFERDHYDVPEQAYDQLLAAGAVPVSTREIVTALQAAGLRRRKSEVLGRRLPGSGLVRPPRLRRGDLVAVVAPAGPVPADRLARGVSVLESFGLRVAVAAQVLARHAELPYLAGTDAERAAALEQAWTDPMVRAVVMARGGYGVQRIIDGLDWAALAAAGPKVLLGFSDLTALHQAFTAELGLVTLHGPGVTSLGGPVDAVSREHLRRTLLQPELALDLVGDSATQTLVGGRATGPLVGGNVALLAAQLATPHSRSAEGAIAVLEDVGEEPFRADRLLTHLLRAGWFLGVRGIALGSWADCGDPAVVRAVLRDRLGPLGVPMLAGVPVGHGPANRTIPLGVEAVLDADAGTLRAVVPGLC